MTEYSFTKAVPVWEEGKEKEMNYWLCFRAETGKHESITLALTGSSAYIVKVNGAFAAFGPARCAHGYYRVDELDLSSLCTHDKNIITITALGYNCTSFYHLCQPSFLCAELICDGKVTAATGDSGFTARYILSCAGKEDRAPRRI